MGHEVEVVCRYAGEEGTTNYGPLLAERATLALRNRSDRPGTTRVTTLSPPPHVNRARSRFPVGLSKLLLAPDPSILFWSRMESTVLGRVAAFAPDVLLSTSPPHSIHAVAARMSAALGVAWVADYRDPHLQDRRYGPFGVRRLMTRRHRAHERLVYSTADSVIHVNPLHYESAIYRYPGRRSTLSYVPNGVPPVLTDSPAPRERSPGLIVVIGSFGNEELTRLVDAASSLQASGLSVRVRVASHQPLPTRSLNPNWRDVVTHLGHLPHSEAVEELRSASVLVSCVSHKRSLQSGLSSRLFEFMATGRPILAINPLPADEVILTEYDSVSVLRRPSVSDIVSALTVLLESPGASDRCVKSIRRRYNREDQVMAILKVMQDAIEHHSARRSP
jgi:glycosyltransferase involved in cell wall biosynthesis